MKFKLYKNSAAPLVIPNAALTLAELRGESVTAHVAEAAVVLLSERMTAPQTIAAIGTLSELTEGLMLALAEACDGYPERSGTDTENACADCGHSECRGIELPPCLRGEAGFGPDAGYEASVVDRKIVITPASVLDADFLAELPEALRTFAAKKDLDVGVLRAMAEEEREVVYGG